MESLDKQVIKDIENKSYLKAINALNVIISNAFKHNENDDQKERDVNDNRVKYLLIRGYCYHRMATEEAMDLALEDVLLAMRCGGKRYQPYLLAGVILMDMKRYEESLRMFETSIRCNSRLSNVLTHNLNYLKFKVLSERGVDEQTALMCAVECHHIEECVILAASRRRDPLSATLLSLIFDNKRMKSCAVSGGSETSVEDDEPIPTTSTSRRRSTAKLVSEEQSSQTSLDDKCVNCRPEVLAIRAPIEANDELIPTTGSDESCDLDFDNELLTNETTDDQNIWYSSDEYIDNTADANVEHMSRMCLTEDRMSYQWIEIGNREDKKKKHKQNVYHSRSSSVGWTPEMEPTNIFKLRGLYVGNLKSNCDQKSLWASFKTYGTIQNIFQPQGVGYAFVHFNIRESATRVLAEWNHRPHSQCKEGASGLVMRFVPSHDQMAKYHAMPYKEYKKRCNDAHECDRWRSGDQCLFEDDCPHRHIRVCRSIDTVPEPQKANWKRVY